MSDEHEEVLKVLLICDPSGLCACSRDEAFSVSSVLVSDVIHATTKDVPCIFKVGEPVSCGSACSLDPSVS